MFLKLEQTANEGFDKTISLSMCLLCVSTISSCGMKSVSCLSNVAAYNQWPTLRAADTLSGSTLTELNTVDVQINVAEVSHPNHY